MNLAFALMLLQSGGTVDTVVFPEEFHGVWDATAQSCVLPISQIRIKIDGAGIHYWESDGKPVKINESANVVGGRNIVLELAMSGEGENWVSKTQFAISNDKQRLFAMALDADVIWFYHRCDDSVKIGWGNEVEPQQ